MAESALEGFRQSLADPAPHPGLGRAIAALWWAGKPDWDRAHGVAQQDEADPACNWVHAHLHRVEGDATNAAYWYGLAGKPVATEPLDAEWQTIATALLGKPVSS